jgi:hypothetical protein
VTPTQCKAARDLLGWKLLDLGYRSRTSEKTVSRFETVRGVPAQTMSRPCAGRLKPPALSSSLRTAAARP